MKKREPVSHIMTEAVITVDKTTHDLRDIREIFRQKKIRHIPVTDGDELAGIISSTDFEPSLFWNDF